MTDPKRAEIVAEMRSWLELVTLTKDPANKYVGIDVFKVKAWADGIEQAAAVEAIAKATQP